MSSSVPQLERAIEAAMRPGDFIDYKRNSDFVHRLNDVAAGEPAEELSPSFRERAKRRWLRGGAR